MTSTVPAKSQPLHNFSLSLKWKTNAANNHQRGRRLADSAAPHQSPPPDSSLRQSPLLTSAPKQSPIRESASESEAGSASPFRNRCVVEESRKNRAPETIRTSEKRSAVADGDGGVREGRSKLSIRFRAKNKADDVQEEGKASTVGEAEEMAAKTWNLRPRRPIQKNSNASGGASKAGGAESKAQLPPATANRPESIWLRSGPELNTEEKKEKKMKFSIPLLRDEIEEDIFIMTGSKPARRPKKRAKAIQKQLDNVFPGLWLGSITPDSYKVSEAPIKG